MKSPRLQQGDLHMAGHTAGQQKRGFELRRPDLRIPAEGFYRYLSTRLSAQTNVCFANNLLGTFRSTNL